MKIYDESVFDDVVQRAINRFGRIDVLVNNAGSGRITNFEETAEESIRGLFEVNVFGLMRMTRAVLPAMREQKAGHIFNIASGAGYSAGPVAYHTSKFAVTGFSTSLSFEVAPFGIKVINVAPGLFRTSFYDEGAMITVPDIHISDYDDFRWQTDFIKNNSDHNQPGNPDKLAKLIVDVANTANPPLHLPVGEDAVGVIDALKVKLKEDVDAWRDKAGKTSFE
jgi:NAD(P)-dependent dehydrogenase (short-subunit alcohol dehydrogenase family)